MNKTKLSRRDFLKLAGATSTGLVLSACGVRATEFPAATATAIPSATLPPSPTPRPQVKVLKPANVYTGPCNVGYDTVSLLSKDNSVTPVSVFGEFVKLESQAGDESFDGFVEGNLLDTIPFELPTIPASEVPWLQKNVVSAKFPLTFVSESPEYQGYNILGTTLFPDTDFQIDLQISMKAGEKSPRETSNGISISLLDESERPKRIFIGYESGSWNLGYYQNDSPIAYEMLARTSNKNGKLSLNLSKNNSVARITLPNEQNKSIDLGRTTFLPSETVRIAVQVAPFSTVSIEHLSVAQLPTGKLETNRLLLESLGKMAEKHNLTFGTYPDEAEKSNLGEKIFATHATLLVWNLDWSLETEVEGFDNMKITPSALAFAEAHNMRVRAHPLIWGLNEFVPKWLKNGGFTRSEIEGLIRNRIYSLMTEYNNVGEWVVVNEALGSGAVLDNNFWHRLFGKQYIDMAFRFAREANPDAVLIYNEAEIDRPNARAKFVYNLLKEFMEEGMPIDGVGMQFHLKAINAPTKSEMLETIQLLGSLGLGVYITELDVNLFGLQGSRDEKWARQAEIYRDVVEAALQSGVCKSITTWGLSDKHSWLLEPAFQFLGGGEAPLLFDDDYNPKPAYLAVFDALQKF